MQEDNYVLKTITDTLPRNLMDSSGNLFRLVIEYDIHSIGDKRIYVYYRGMQDKSEELRSSSISVLDEQAIKYKIQEIEDKIEEKGMLVLKKQG